MDFEKFYDGNHFSIGIELELRILDKFDLTPKNEFEYIYSNINKKYKNCIAKEFLDSMLEINTPIFNNQEDLIDYLKEIINELIIVADKKNLVIQTSGTYAQKSDNFNITKNKRYKEIYDEHKILLDNFSICGLHVHIGFEDFDKALKAYNYSVNILPLFLALSASSLYYDGIDTGIDSYRTKIFERLPKSSIPEYFDSYDQMKNLYDLLEKSKVIKNIKDIWWDVRIQPHFKTVEFRVCDAINDFERLEVIIGLFRAICQLAQMKKTEKLPYQLLKQNMWSATRYSMNGNIILSDGEILTIKDMILEILKQCEDSDIVKKEFLVKVKKIIKEDSTSKKMQKIFEKTKSLKEVERLGVFE